MQITLTVNGNSPQSPWLKTGLRPGDSLLISRPLGTGVLFAGAMSSATKAADLDTALKNMVSSQHTLLKQLEPVRGDIHACTDITGFGLLGHLGEMIQNSPELMIQLDSSAIPAYTGSLELFERGVCSTLAPSNRAAWRLLDGPVQLANFPTQGLLELLIDPQTCGPLLVSCPKATAHELVKEGPWKQIGFIKHGHS